MSGDGFNDEVDDLALGDALRRMAGPLPDADAALPGLHRRVRVARMRRVSAVAASVAIVAVTGTAVGLSAGRGSDRIGPSDTPSTLPTDSTAGGDSDSGTDNPDNTPGYGTGGGSTPGGTTASTSPGAGTVPSTRPGSGSVPSGSTTTTTIDDGGSDDGGSDDHGGGSDDDGGSDDSGAAGEGREDTTGTTTATRVSRRCTSAAGAFTAVFNGTTSATIVSPAAGYSVHEVEQEGDSAKVVFRKGESEVAVEARWTGSLFVCATSA